MIKEVTCFKTTDGKVFGTLHEADQYEAVNRFIEWYESKEGDRIQGVFAEELAIWIAGNSAQILPMISNRP